VNKRTEELINAYCSGNITDKEFQEFEDILRADPAARKLLLEYRSLDTSLRNKADAAVIVHQPESLLNAAPVYNYYHGIWKIFAVAAILSFSIFGVLFFILKKELKKESGSIPIAAEIKSHDGKAVLMRSYNAEWNGLQIEDGDSLSPMELSLKSGIAELEFYGGASVILQGPAVFTVIDGQHGRLSSGRLRSYVPSQAHGFTIDTPDAKVVDLGTSFGMKVDLESTAVEVFEGEVEVSNIHDGNAKTILKAGAGLRMGKGINETIKPDEAFYSNVNDLSDKISVRSKANYAKWQERIFQVKSDSRILARYNFSKFQERGRFLQNTSVNSYKGLDGAIVGARWAEGRWPQKSALDFKGPGDCVRVEIPGSYKSVTLTAWIRIDGLDNTFNSLILSNGWRRIGAFHWQIGKEDFVELAVWNGESNPNSRAKFKVRPSDLGRWMHVAVVYNGESGTVTHFRNGKALKSVILEHVVPIEISKAQIGNWYPPEVSRREIRNLNGRMDDFVIYKVALADQEIAEIYENSKP
jgi:hypothetical protein